MSDGIRLSGVTVNAPDAIALARFYAVITGGVATGSLHWAAVSGPYGFIAFQRVDDLRPPEWPEGAVPMQLHLDFFVDDLAAAEVRVLAAGATRFDLQPNSDHCFVYADPAGHPFCLSTWDGPQLAEDFDETVDIGSVHLSELLSSLSTEVERALKVLVKGSKLRGPRSHESVCNAVAMPDVPPESIRTKLDRPNHTLTADLIEEVIAAYQAGETCVRIGGRLGIHRTTVTKLVERAGLPLRVTTPRMDGLLRAQARELYEQGLSLAKVSAKIGVPGITIKRALLAGGVQLRARSERIPAHLCKLL